MKKNELMTGDIVVLSSGNLAVVIRNTYEDYLLYQEGGWESLDDYNDEMVYLYPENDALDAVMQVYRAQSGGISFSDYEDDEPIYERDYTWANPKESVRPESITASDQDPITSDSNEDSISIIAQGFYGNRTGTDIRIEDIDRFILGYLDNTIPVTEAIDRTIVHLPGSELLVLIYNKYEEEERRSLKTRAWEEAQYEIKPLASIPEMGMEIYSRCIACRMTAAGDFQSIENEDLDILGKYLAK